MGKTWYCEACEKEVRITTIGAMLSWTKFFKMIRCICPICGHKKERR